MNDIENNGLSQRKSAGKYDIPLSTLNDAYNKVRSSHKIGRKPILGEEIEENLYQIIIRLSDVGVGLNKYERLKAIRQYLINNNLRQENGEPLFKNNCPTNKWYTGFLNRHPMLSQRVAKNLAVCRSKSYTYEIAEEWYNSVVKLYNELWPDGKVPATHLWNSDESGHWTSSGRNETFDGFVQVSRDSGHQGSNLIVCKRGMLFFKYRFFLVFPVKNVVFQLKDRKIPFEWLVIMKNVSTLSIMPVVYQMDYI